MYPIKQSTAITVPFFVHDVSGDAVTGLTGGSFTKRISKGSGAFAAMTVTITEMENGWYSIPLSTTHSNTLGILSITFTNAGAKQVNLQFRVTAKLLDDLNDVAATDIVSAGAITTSSGAVSTITTLTNLPAITANWLTAAGINAGALDGKGDWNVGKTGYSLTQSFPTNFADMSITVTTGLVDITQTAADKMWDTATRILTAGTNIALAKGVGLTGLNDLSAAQVNAEADTALADFFTSSVQLVDDIWDEPLSGHTTNNTAGKVLKGINEGWVSAEGSVNDASASTTEFITDLTEATTGFYNDAIVVFTTGTLKGQSRVIFGYDGTTKTITLDEAFTSAPGDTETFIILAGHVHSMTDIVNSMLDELLSGHTDAGSLGKAIADIEVDTADIQPKIGTPAGADMSADIAALQSDSDDIQTRIPAALVGGRMSSDMEAVSGDSVAADNIEATFDGTGYADDNAPSTQAQVGAIGSAGGGALSFEVEADNATVAIKGVSKVGTETGTFANTEAEDGVYHVITHAANVIDWIYQVAVGGGRVANSVTFKGYLSGSNDILDIQAYDFIGADWETRAVLSGQAGTNNITQSVPLLSKHTGTGSDIGKVLIRFIGTATSPVLNTDELLVEAVSIGQTVGYALGRVWINTSSGTAGTEDYVNGTADNPSLTLTDAVTIAASIGLSEYSVSSDSTITLAADLNNVNMYGVGYTLDFAGFDVAGSHFYHASPVDGIVTSANNADHLDILGSIVNNVTVDDGHFTNCSFKGTVTLGSVASDVRVIDCRSVIAGASTPIFDFGTGLVNHNMTVANWQNGIEIRNFNVAGGGTDLLSISGTGQIVIAASCDGGTINLRGQWRVTDNSGGAVTITKDDPATDIDSILTDTGTSIPALLPVALVGGRMDSNMSAVAGVVQSATNLEASTDTIAAGTASGTPSTTAMISDISIAVDDQFKGKTIIFASDTTTAALRKQATDITASTASSNTLTFTALTTAPSSGDTFVVV